MKDYRLEIERLKNGYVLRIEWEALPEEAHSSTSVKLSLATRENLFNCISIYYDDGHEAAIRYACAKEK